MHVHERFLEELQGTCDLRTLWVLLGDSVARTRRQGLPKTAAEVESSCNRVAAPESGSLGNLHTILKQGLWLVWRSPLRME